MQAAIGCAQLEKLDNIVEARRKNYATLYEGLKGTPGIILPEPTPNSNPSWFGFLITVKDDAPFTRNELTGYLESKRIQTRNLFAGNFLKHPCFDEFRDDTSYYRQAGTLEETDRAMRQTFWIGVYPGMTQEKLSWMITCIREFCEQNAR